MLTQGLRRWPNIETAPGQLLVLGWLPVGDQKKLTLD